jgi:hypothetical protein
MKKLISILISAALLIQITPPVCAKPKGDWETVKALVDRSNAIAVQTRLGATHFGLVQSVNDYMMTVQLAGRDEMMSQTIHLKRDEVTRVWRARLRFDEDNVKKAAWIGAAAGVGVVAAIVAANHDAEDAPAGAAYIVLIGAGAGALAGRLWKKKHKKQELIYSV